MKNYKIRIYSTLTYLIAIAWLLPSSLFAQLPGDTIWTNNYGLPQIDVGEAVRQTSDGGFILCGMGVIPNYNLYDFLLVKTDASGNQIWSRYYGGPYVEWAKDVQQTIDGGYIVAGYTSLVPNVFDVWLLKTNANGDSMWAALFGGNNNDYGYSVEQTSDGGYILGGANQGSGQAHYNAYLVKTYANGSLNWDEEYGGNQTDEFGYRVTQTSDGGYILVGKTNASGNEDVYVVKTDFTGGVEWENTFGGTNTDVAWSVIENSDGDFVIAGETFSFGSGMRSYVLKVSPSGSLIWQKNYGLTTSQRAKEIAETIDGGYAIFGGKGPYPANDVYVIRADSQGTVIWEDTYGRVDRAEYGWGGCIADDTVFMAVGESNAFSDSLKYDVWLLAINSGLQGEPRGACCDDTTGICEDNILQSQCDGRFAAGTLCVNMVPPCGGGVGCEEDEILVKIMTDDFPEETTWEITDKDYITVGSGGPYPGQANTLVVDTVCVDSLNCYNFVIYDSEGNGIVPGGYFELWFNSSLVGANYSFDSDSDYVSYVGSRCGGLGACCDDSLGECNMYIDQFDCGGANRRFIGWGFCDDFYPPCGGCPEDLIEIRIMTDVFPEEITWEFRDDSGGLLASGGPYTGSPNTLFTEFICVDSSDCYSFTIYDDYGDGIFPPGYFEIYLNDSLLVHNGTFCAEFLTVSHLGNGCGPILGACCDDSTGDCNEDIEEQNCQGPSMRFIADGRCRDFNPPCGGCADDEIKIEIMPDDYPREITWALLVSGTSYLVASGGPLDRYNTLYEYSYCANPDSCYDFYIFDSEGDGICCDYGIGYYRVYLNGALIDSGGQYGAVDTVVEIGSGCPVRGACCDDSTAECNENVEEQNCQGSNMRFIAGGSCDDFYPPCGGCPQDMFDIHIMTDHNPSEITWEFRDGSGGIMASGGPYTGAPDTLFTNLVCAESTGCYSFAIFDSSGDGIFPPGYFEIYLDDSLLVSNSTFCAESLIVSHLGNGCGPILGACCDDSTGDCNEDIEEQNCQGPSMRFIADGRCEDFNPPCGGCADDVIKIEIMPDNYPREITWALTLNDTSYVVASGGPLDKYNMLYEYSYCADPDSCYDFYIFDSEENGICCDYGIGYYRIYLNEALVDSGGQYGAVDTVIEIGNGCGPGCDYVVGDVNGSDSYNGLDITYGVSFFKGGPVPMYECECTPGNIWYVSGDVNASCNYNGLDITYGVAYFKGGSDPMPCPDCPPPELMRLQIIKDSMKNMDKDHPTKSKAEETIE